MNNKWTKENFELFDAQNPFIYDLFEQFALQIAQKKSHYSAKSIFHRIRWETAVGDYDGDFKIDDGWISHYARKFAKEHPKYEALFEFRTRRESYHNKQNQDWGFLYE
jgi:hypothetical protein